MSESNEKRQPHRWWRYVVIRGEGIPAELDGKWYDLQQVRERFSSEYVQMPSGTFKATNMWEQRDDGEVAVVYMPKTGRLSPEACAWDEGFQARTLMAYGQAGPQRNPYLVDSLR